MKTIGRNILAAILGLFVGGMVNMGLILVSGFVVAPPPGVDVTTTEGLRNSIHLFEPKHFVFPFLAHAMGTFTGAFVATLLAASRKKIIALVVGSVNLLGGIAAASMIPAPLWFDVLDLVGAYIPMAWLGITLSNRLVGSSPTEQPTAK